MMDIAADSSGWSLRTVAPQQSVARDAFLNAIRILHSIDGDEFLDAGGTKGQWNSFRDNPAEFLMRADDPTTDAIWSAIQKRQPARYRA